VFSAKFWIWLWIWPAWILLLGLRHDFHVSYGRMAVENEVAVLQLRFFQDDLEKALVEHGAPPAFRLASTPAADSTALAYISLRLRAVTAGDTLQAVVSASGEDLSGQEPMWWYLLEYQADAPIRKLTLVNELLLDTFDDQKNIVQLQHFPSEKTWSFYFSEDARAFTIDME
jgi:hypothetical protein